MPGLGLPRLANLQSGHLSPFSLLFYLLPTARAFSLYPTLVLSALALFCFGLFRAKGLSVLPALFGALSWASLGNVIDHVQHPPFLETLVWLPATLLAWERYRRSRNGKWAVAAGIGVAFQCIGAPQFILYNGLLMALWIGLDLWEARAERRALLGHLAVAVGIAALGVALASWQLLLSLELASDSHRNLLPSPGFFANYARATPSEVLLALAAEVFWLFESPPPLAHGAPYVNLPNLSLVTLCFATLAAFCAPRRRVEWLAVAFFLLGMLGADGGVSTALGWVVPFADRIRAPIRMIVPAGFLLSWLAACGMQRWPRTRPAVRRGLAILAIGWLGLLSYALQWRDDAYEGPEAFRAPAALASAEPRVAVDVRGSQGLPLFGVNAALAAGIPNLLPRAALRPRNYFEALFASQYGSLGQLPRLNRMISATVLSLTDPNLPLIRSFGLRTLIRYRDGAYEAVPLRGAVPRFFIAPRVRFLPDRRARWAAAADAGWDPLREVISAKPIASAALPGDGEIPSRGAYGSVRVLADAPDRQLLGVESAGGVLVSSALFYPGWTVRVDGEPARGLELNLALRGVLVPRGSHRVEWIYRPTWLPSAWAATALGVSLAFALWLGLRRAPS